MILSAVGLKIGQEVERLYMEQIPPQLQALRAQSTNGLGFKKSLCLLKRAIKL